MKVAGRITMIMLFVFLNRAYAQGPLPFQKEYEPKNGKGHVVVVVSGQTGPGSYEYYAKDIAEQGYYTVLVDGNDFWSTAGKGEALLKSVITQAQRSPHALAGKATVIGFSIGGASALTFAARLPKLVCAVVAYYPLTKFITDPSDFVSKIKVPTLIFAGGRDTYKDCCVIEMARKLADAAKASAGKIPLEVIEYPRAGHGFSIKSLPAWSRNDASDAFRRTLSHLHRYADE